jgi:hypothetical protein
MKVIILGLGDTAKMLSLLVTPELMKLLLIAVSSKMEGIINKIFVTFEMALRQSTEVRKAFIDSDLFTELLGFVQLSGLEHDFAFSVILLVTRVNSPMYLEQPNDLIKQKCAKVVTHIMLTIDNDELKMSCLNSLQVLCTNSSLLVKLIISDTVLAIVGMMTKHSNNLIITARGLSVFYNLAASREPEILEKLCISELFKFIISVISNTSHSMRKNALICLNRLPIDIPEHSKLIFEFEFVKKVFELINAKDSEIKNEAISFICTAVIAGSEELVDMMHKDLKLICILTELFHKEKEIQTVKIIGLALKTLLQSNKLISKKFKDNYFNKSKGKFVDKLLMNIVDLNVKLNSAQAKN